MKRAHIKTTEIKQAVDITDIVKSNVDINEGILIVYVPHTTAGVTINEAYDRDVAIDMLDKLQELVPYSNNYRHLEGNSDAHIQASLIGSSVTIIIKDGKLKLGRWQGIFFMEFDGPRNREIYIKTIEG